MMRYGTAGYRAVEAAEASEAAAIFARRIAQKEFGKRGFCRTMRVSNWASDGSTVTYEAFIGVPVRGEPGLTSGRNVIFTVYRV
jgi:hypothetical protein